VNRERLLDVLQQRGENVVLNAREEALRLAQARLEGRTHEDVDIEGTERELERLNAGPSDNQQQTRARGRRRDRER
jgi:hypothetical protein